MTWQLAFFTIAFALFVWHIVSDTGDDDPDDEGCPLCDALIMHTHERR
jgi:hypothetical protein